MTAQIIDGKAIAQKTCDELKAKISSLPEGVPSLAVILVGDDEASQIYVRNKKKKATEVGIDCHVIELSASIGEIALLSTIDELNENYSESLGLIVTDTLPVILAKRDDGLYDEKFFNAVMDIPHGFARVIQTGSSIYVVERAVIATNDEDAFAQYSEEILEYMKMDSIDKMITKRADKLKIEG
jgi:hypothetical protein